MIVVSAAFLVGSAGLANDDINLTCTVKKNGKIIYVDTRHTFAKDIDENVKFWGGVVENATGTAGTVVPAINANVTGIPTDQGWRFMPNTLSYSWT